MPLQLLQGREPERRPARRIVLEARRWLATSPHHRDSPGMSTIPCQHRERNSSNLLRSSLSNGRTARAQARRSSRRVAVQIDGVGMTKEVPKTEQALQECARLHT